MAGFRSKMVGMPAVRRKQMIILTALLLVVAGVALMAGLMGAPKSKAQAQDAVSESTRKAFGTPGERIDPATLWKTQEGARVQQLEQDLKDIQARLAAQERTAQAAEKQRKEMVAVAMSESPAKLPRTEPPEGDLPIQPMPLGPLPPSPDLDPPRQTGKGIVRTDIGNSRTRPVGAARTDQAVTTGGGLLKSVPDASEPDVSGGKRVETYIPAGTFVGGVLLSGVDAPTGGQSQENPHPVIIEVLDLASMPNKFKADYKHCRITANAVGDLSSERAYIRLDRLSCISEDGGALDIGVKGYVADQSGKAGVRGRLVSKQGQVLANALLSGVASGMGQAFSQNSVTNSVSALGSMQTMKDGEQYRYGMGQGVGIALQHLSKYYIQLAEKLFPVIEVDAGQPIDIVITKGVSAARR